MFIAPESSIGTKNEVKGHVIVLLLFPKISNHKNFQKHVPYDTILFLEFYTHTNLISPILFMTLSLWAEN